MPSMLTRRRVGRLGARRSFGYGGLIRTGAGAVGALYRSYKNSQRNSQRRSGKQTNTGFLSTQYDVKQQYRRRRMPRRKRRAWVKKIRMVNTITNKKLGSQFQILRSRVIATAAADTQTSFSCGIYGENGVPATSSDIGIADLFELNNLSGDTGVNNNWWLKSGVIDIEISNVGTDAAANPFTVDCYEIVCRRTVNTQGGVAPAGPNDMFITGFAATQQPILGTNSLISPILPGVTPFQNSIFCTHFKILKKTRVLVSVGQATHFMFRDAKDRRYRYESSSRPVCSPMLYHGFLFILQGVTTSTAYSGAISASCTAIRYYDYVREDTNTTAAGYTNL